MRCRVMEYKAGGVEVKATCLVARTLQRVKAARGLGSLSRFQVEDLYKETIQLPARRHVNRKYI